MAAAPDPQVCNHGKGAPCPTIRDGPPDVLGVTNVAAEAGPVLGVVGLLGLLLRSMLHRESQWQTERAELIKEHDERYDRAAADYERHLTLLRNQYTSLEQTLRADISTLTEKVTDLTVENTALRGEIASLKKAFDEEGGRSEGT